MRLLHSPDAPFPTEREANFRSQRCAELARINAISAWRVAIGLLLFAVWDAYLDPVQWQAAFVWRAIGAFTLLALAWLQQRQDRAWTAPVMAKIGFFVAVMAVALALGELRGGLLFGLTGLGVALCAGACVALDRRDYFWLSLFPVLAVLIMLMSLDLERFVIVNALCALAISLFVGRLLAGAFESSNRRAFLMELAIAKEARTDVLTEIANRRAIDEGGARTVAGAKGSNQPLAVILLDIDHFKQINDKYGHLVGDLVIRKVAAELNAVVRSSDMLGRWGGEEFLILLPSTTFNEAHAFAERVRKLMAAVKLVEVPTLNLTVSLGVACLEPGRTWESWSDLVLRADRALYIAKAQGRNKVAVEVDAQTGAQVFQDSL